MLVVAGRRKLPDEGGAGSNVERLGVAVPEHGGSAAHLLRQRLERPRPAVHRRVRAVHVFKGCGMRARMRAGPRGLPVPGPPRSHCR